MDLLHAVEARAPRRQCPREPLRRQVAAAHGAAPDHGANVDSVVARSRPHRGRCARRPVWGRVGGTCASLRLSLRRDGARSTSAPAAPPPLPPSAAVGAACSSTSTWAGGCRRARHCSAPRCLVPRRRKAPGALRTVLTVLVVGRRDDALPAHDLRMQLHNGRSGITVRAAAADAGNLSAAGTH